MDNWLRELEDCQGKARGISLLVGKRKSANEEDSKRYIEEIAEEVEIFRKKLDMLKEDLTEMAKNPVTFRMFVYYSILLIFF